MKTIIPFTKEIALDDKIAEITSISLEHELHLDESGIKGDFIISGDYKAHEISINRDPFTYRLPFDVELGDSLDRSTLNFDIVDFNYELLDNELLRVNIEFSVEADESEDIALEESDENLQKIKTEEDRIAEELDDFIIPEKTLEDKEIEQLLDTETETRLDEESKELILNNLEVGDEEGYATYRIHIVKDGESVESICALYNITVDTLKSYNDNIEELLALDKLLIPSDKNE